MCGYVLACVSAPGMCLAPKEARTGSWIPWDLELQKIVSLPVDAGNQSLCLVKEQPGLSAAKPSLQPLMNALSKRTGMFAHSEDASGIGVLLCHTSVYPHG